MFDYEKIEKINFFDPITQRTKKEFSRLTIKDIGVDPQVIDKTNFISGFKTGVLVKSDLEGQSYSFSVGLSFDR